MREMTLSFRCFQLASVVGLALIFFCSPIVTFLFFSLLFTLLFVDCDVSTKLMELFGTKPESSHIRNCVVWITGASSGIGEALAYELSRCGATVVLSGRNETELDRVAKNCKNFKCKDCLVLPFDITHFERHHEAFNSILSSYGKVDVLVNNAGRSCRGMFLDESLEMQRKLFDLDYFAPIHLSKIVLKEMIAKGTRGQIVLVTSVAKYGVPFQSAYCGAKCGLHGAFEAVRVEMASHGINVLFAVPGPVESAVSENAFVSMPGKSSDVASNGESESSSGVGSSVETASSSKRVIDKQMTAERTARLMAVAIANRSSEVWIAERPCIYMCYALQYLPSLSKIVLLPLMQKRMKAYQQAFSR